MADFNLTLRELAKGRLFPIGQPHVINATIGRGHLIEMEDLNFHHDSAVMLPDPHCDNDPATLEQDRITGLSVLRAVFRHAQEHPRERLLIAGHADTSGQPEPNVVLSQQRADSVLFALSGDKEKWAQLSNTKHKVEDYQDILKWIDNQFAWGTDPGAIDNQEGDKTQKALRAFQKRYNQEFAKSIAVDGKIGLDTWRGFFDVYMLGLKEIAQTDDEGLAKMRGAITFLDAGKPTVGCGETHPIEAADKDDFRSATNRRVELLFFDPQDKLPKLDCHAAAGKCDPKLCEIYGKGLFDFSHIACQAATPGFSGAFGDGETVKPEDSVAPPQQTGDDPPPRPRTVDASAIDDGEA